MMSIIIIIVSCCSVTQPLCLAGLISFYSDPEKLNSDDQTEGYLYAVGVILCSLFNVMFMHPYMLGMFHTGMKVRVAMCSMIYRKALRLSRTALGDTTIGQVVNLISNDVGRLDVSVIHMHYLWLGPVEIGVVTWLMWREVNKTEIPIIVQDVIFYNISPLSITDWRFGILWSGCDVVVRASAGISGQEDLGATSKNSSAYG